MFPACGTKMKQTNHCKLTMVWCEDDISFLFVLLQRSRDGCRSRDSVCLFQSRLLAEKRSIDESRSERLYLLEDAEDGGKVWSREGQEEEVSLSDIGWFRSRDVSFHTRI